MKNFKTLCFILITALGLAACSGKHGDPGPTGPAGSTGDKGDKGDVGATGADAIAKAGSIQGTITGTRNDGTAINETFAFEYPFPSYFGGDEYFKIYEAEKYINITRTSADLKSNISFRLKMVNEGTATETLVPANIGETFELNFIKYLSATQALEISANAYLADQVAYHPLSYQKNVTYKFALDPTNDAYATENDVLNGVSVVIFYTLSNQKVFYNQTTGAFIKVVNPNNAPVTKAVADLYAGLRFDKATYTFYDAANADLSESIPVPADVFTISNYKLDAATGILSFDFNITIAGIGRYTNSTHHALSVVGKFNSGPKLPEM